jgi:hypothetical protein
VGQCWVDQFLSILLQMSLLQFLEVCSLSHSQATTTNSIDRIHHLNFMLIGFNYFSCVVIDGLLDLSREITLVSGYLRINCTVTGITTANTFVCFFCTFISWIVHIIPLHYLFTYRLFLIFVESWTRCNCRVFENDITACIDTHRRHIQNRIDKFQHWHAQLDIWYSISDWNFLWLRPTNNEIIEILKYCRNDWWWWNCVCSKYECEWEWCESDCW